MASDVWEGLLRQVGPAHHEAFAATGGDDPEWPRWYARWLHERLPAEVQTRVGEEALAGLLQEAAAAHPGEADWPAAYARFLSGRIA